jgi:thermitase
MFQYKANGKQVTLPIDEGSIAVRFHDDVLGVDRVGIVDNDAFIQWGEDVAIPNEKFTTFQRLTDKQEGQSDFWKKKSALEAEDRVVRAVPTFKLGQNRVVVTDRLLVGFVAKTTTAQRIIRKQGGTIIRRLGNEYLVQLPSTQDPFAIAEKWELLPEIDYVEPDFVVIGQHITREPADIPPVANDALLSSQYAMEITQATTAWGRIRPRPNVVVAILDEGVDIGHTGLARAVFHTFDVTSGGPNQTPNPWDGHGTACAGLAVATPDNGVGIRGIAGGCGLFAIRIASSPAQGERWTFTQSKVIEGIDEAWQRGAWILSNSWTNVPPSTAMTNALNRARTQGRSGRGCVIVFAAGNDGEPVPYPSNLDFVLTVGASNEWDEPKTIRSRDGENYWASNMGPEVDIAAPGVHILTTDISGPGGYSSGDYYPSFNGTSSATPLVAGAAALLLSLNPLLTETQVRSLLTKSADKVPTVTYINGHNNQMGFGRLNVLKAIIAAGG